MRDYRAPVWNCRLTKRKEVEAVTKGFVELGTDFDTTSSTQSASRFTKRARWRPGKFPPITGVKPARRLHRAPNVTAVHTSKTTPKARRRARNFTSRTTVWQDTNQTVLNQMLALRTRSAPLGYNPGTLPDRNKMARDATDAKSYIDNLISGFSQVRHEVAAFQK